MNLVLIPFTLAGVLSNAFGKLFDKKVLLDKNVKSKDFVVYAFGIVMCIMLLVLPFFFKIDPAAFVGKNLAVLLTIITLSIFANIFGARAVKHGKLTELESVRMFLPLFTMLFAFILYEQERNLNPIILFLALIASLSLIIGHVKKHHLRFKECLMDQLFADIFYALEFALSLMILHLYNPLSFYFVRALLIFPLAVIIFRPKISRMRKVKKSTWLFFIASGAAWVINRVLHYFGYANYGVIFTTLLFTIVPVFIYIFSGIFLKEKPSKRNIISTAIILICVTLAIVINGG